MARVIVLVIDGFGIGHAPDAADFGDVSANTFANLLPMKFYCTCVYLYSHS